MLPYRDSRFTILLIVVFFGIIAVYAYFEARNALYGPHIDLSQEYATVYDQLVSIRGEARNIAELRINGNPVPVTEAGVFEESHVLAPGYNRIVLEARDTYGRSRERVLEIMYTPREATSTPKETLEATSTNPLPKTEEGV